MELLHDKHLPFGISACYTSANYRFYHFRRVLSTVHLQSGRLLHLVFPLYAGRQRRRSSSCCPHPEQREDDVSPHPRDSRQPSRSSPWTSRTTASMSAAASPAAAATCTSTPTATSIRACSSTTPTRTSANCTLLEALQSPMFMAYHDGQPFNENHAASVPDAGKSGHAA